MQAPSTDSPGFLAGGGEMGALIRAKDWSKTPLGPPESWPPSLRTAVSIMLETHIGMHIAWGDDYIQLYNDGYRPVLGETKHPAALGLPIRVSFPEIWEDFVRPKFADVMRGEPFGAENMLVPQDRNHYLEEGYFTFSYSPIRDEFGRIGGVLTTETETTEHVIRERRLRTLRNVASATSTVSGLAEAGTALMRALRENPHDVPFALLYVTNPAGTQAELSEHVRLESHEAARPARVDLTASSAPAWPLGNVLDTDAPRLLTDLASRFGALPGGAWPEPTQAAYLLPIRRLDRGQPYGVLVLGVNPRKVFDAAHREFFEALADQATRMFATVSALEEERRRNEALRELDRTKTRFFSNVSHEFRTPLTLMLGPLEEAMKANELPALVHENLETAHRNALRLQKLVNSLLDFSRIEAGRLQARYAPTDLATLTADLASSFRSVVERAGMRLVVDCPPLPEPAFVDRDMWEKIVLNLLSNAFKYTLDGGIAVRLTAEDGQAVLRVEDTGVGIPAVELPRLFERFHRVAGSQGRSFEGTGIGLSLIRELVSLHGGSIGVESEPGLGSTFIVRIPLGTAHLPADRLTDAPATAALGWEAPFIAEAGQLIPDAPPNRTESVFSEKKAHVLLADDNADMRAYIQRLLEPHYRVSVAPDGQAALWLVAEHRPDLVLSDVMMPVMDGLELLKTLKADPQTARIPVVLLSARAGEDATIEGYEAGADDYLVKPFSANELLARVRAQLNMARMRRQNERQLRDLFEQAPVGINILRGPELRFELVNDFYVRLVGRPADQLLGKPVLEALPEITSQGYFDLLTQVMQTGEPMVFTEQAVQFFRNGQFETVYLNFHFEALPKPDAGVFVLIAEVTESVLARQKIEESNRQFQQLADSMPQMVWSTLPDGYHDFYNQRWYDFTGLTYEQTKAEGWASVLHPDDCDRAWAVWRESLATGNVYEIEYRMRRHDGAYVWQLGRALPIRDEAGVIVRWYGTCTDIDDHKRAEEALRQSEERFRRVLDGMGEGFGLLAPDFTILDQNREALRLDGRPREAIVGRSHWEVYPGTETSPLGHLLRKAMAERVPVSLVHRYAWEQGRAHWLEMRAYPTADGLLAVFWHDVTERWEAQDALRRSEEKYRTLFESMDQGYCVVQMLFDEHDRPVDYRFENINPAFARLTGLPEDSVGKTALQLVPDLEEFWVQTYGRVALTGEAVRFENSSEPMHRWFDVYALRVGAPEERRVGILFTNITTRKRREANLAFLADVSSDFTRFSTADEIIETVGPKIGAYLGVSACTFADIDEAADKVSIDHAWETPEIANLRGVYRLSEFVSEDLSRAAHEGVPFVVNDTQTDPRTSAAGYGGYGVHSFVTVPTRRNGEWKFLLSVNCTTRREWQPDEIELLEELTARIFPRLERARAEEALRRQTTLLQTVNDNTTELIFMKDTQGRLTYANQATLDVMGLTAEEAFGNGEAVRFYDQSEAPAIDANDRRVMETGKTITFEEPYTRADGERRIFLSTKTPLRDGSGVVLGVIGVSRDVTERKRTEEALRESEEKYRALFDSIDEGFCIIEFLDGPHGPLSDYVHLEANPAYARHAGIPDVVGQRLRNMVPAEADAWLARYRPVLETGQPAHFEQTLVATGRHLELAAFRLEPPERRQVAVLFTDVTERKRAEAALRESEEKFRALADNISQLAWMTDANGWIFWYNQRWFDYTGTTLDQMQGWGWQAVHAPEEVDRVTAKFKRHIAAGEVWEDTFPLRSKEGEYRWFLSRAIPIRDAAGKILRWFGTNTDVTDQKRAEAEARENEARFRLLANSIPASVYLTDAEGRAIFFNEWWTDYCGVPYEPTAAADVAVRFIHPDDASRVMAAFDESLRTGRPFQVEQRNRRRDGEYRWFLNRAEPYRDPQTGQITQWFGTGVDIHDQKTEAERLDNLVRERTQELRASNAELERSNLDLMQFASVASHDLKEPLRKIQAFGNILTKRLDGKLDERDRDYFNRIIGASDRMQALVEDVLGLSKLSSKDVQYAPVDLSTVVARITDDLEIAIREKAATIRVGQLPTIEAVPGQMHQLFQNLLANALKFTGDRPPVVEVEAVPLTPALRASLALPSGEFAVVEVRDNGIGFDPEYRERIFGMFQRLNGRSEYAGTGIGLTICRKIAENHHGLITAGGQPGQGATFRVVLPVKQLRIEN